MEEIDKLRYEAEGINAEYVKLEFDNVADYKKFKLYSVVTKSTSLEGSTLSELDTQLLLDEGIVAAGKPLEHHLMVKDNYEAIVYATHSATEYADAYRRDRKVWQAG